ncbi:hypothetical protein GCM10028808_28390 [Spirosoma migulaei]
MTLLRSQRYFGGLSLVVLLLWPIAVKSSADHTGDQILGRWLFPARGSSVEVYKSGDRYFGRIFEVSPTGKHQFGVAKNQLLMQNLSFDGKGWSGGELIHPKTGNHFDIELQLLDSQTLTARVYKGFRWLHKEYVLTRAPQ